MPPGYHRVIRNEMVDSINDGVLDMFPGFNVCADSVEEVDQQAVYKRSIRTL